MVGRPRFLARRVLGSQERLEYTLRLVAFGDTHFPFAHKKAIDWAIRFTAKFKPTHVVQVGDLYDLYSFSKFPRSQFISPDEELSQGRLQASRFWMKVKEAAPKAEAYQIMGNHDIRGMRRVLDKAPELEPLVGRSMRELFTFAGVKTIEDPREELVIEGVIVQHGHRSRLGEHSRYNQNSTICGHSHTGGVNFQRNIKGVYWELNAGLLGDVNSKVFSYTAQRKIHTCTLGLALVDTDGPRFVPYPGAD